MRRKDREVTDVNELRQIMDLCKVCRIGMEDQNGIYIVPMNFGYVFENDQFMLFFHSANEGRKITALKEHGEVCFEMDCAHNLIHADSACQYGYLYQSIIGTGQVVFLDHPEDKKMALSAIMKHQTDRDFLFNDQEVKKVTVFKIVVQNCTGKYCL